MSRTLVDEHCELPDEFYDLIQPRLRMIQRGLGSARHKRLM